MSRTRVGFEPTSQSHGACSLALLRRPATPCDVPFNHSGSVTTWVRKTNTRRRSWHLLRLTRSLTPRTRCGRDLGADTESSADLPGGKSCETCARLLIWDQERADG